MSLEACYEMMGGDLEGVRGRLMTDERICKFVPTFLQDESMNALRENLASGNVPEAYRAAHTIKGISRDLGFTPLYEVSYQMQEALRAPEDGSELDLTAAKDLMPQVEEAYDLTVAAIALL